MISSSTSRCGALVDLDPTTCGLWHGPAYAHRAPLPVALSSRGRDSRSQVLRASACPLKRGADGVLADADASLRHATVASTLGRTPLEFWGANVSLPASQPNISAVAAAAWSTAFYAASIVEDATAYEAEKVAEAIGKGLLISTTGRVDSFDSSELLHLIDGGFIDSTGAVALLRRRKRRILLNYVNNDALAPASGKQSELSSIAYLFGVAVQADTMNSIAGPALTQVFPSSLYPLVLSNLTNASRLFARAHSVPVLANSYLGIEPYVLDELLIISNGRSDQFLSSFTDRRVAAAVSAQWPDRMPTGFGAFEANLLCQYERWKLSTHAETLRQFFGQ